MTQTDALHELWAADCMKCEQAVIERNPGLILSRRFITCLICGNKRCPRATDHTLECSGSNEPGQVGSIYT